MPDLDNPGELVALLVLITLLLVLLLGFVLVVRGTIRRQGRWGINFNPPTSCPRCGEALPAVRAPTSLGEALWGGGTCNGCGCRVDKWGHPIA